MRSWPLAHRSLGGRRRARGSRRARPGRRGAASWAPASARAGVLTGEAAVTLGATTRAWSPATSSTPHRGCSGAPPGPSWSARRRSARPAGAIVFQAAGEQDAQGQGQPGPRLAGLASRRAARWRWALGDARGTVRRARGRVPSAQGHPGRGRSVTAAPGSCRSPAPAASARAAWPGSREVHRRRRARTSSGTAAARRPMAKASPSGPGRDGPTARRPRQRATTTETARVRIAATVAEYVPDRRRPGLGRAGLADAAGPRATTTGRTGHALRRLAHLLRAHRRYGGRPVLLFENLQWADGGLLDFIEHVLEWSKGVRLLVVTLARPELFERRSDWGARGPRPSTSRALEPLSDAAMRELLTGFVPWPAGLRRRDNPGAATASPVRGGDDPDARRRRSPPARCGDGYPAVGELGELPIPETLRSLIGVTARRARSGRHSVNLQDAAVSARSSPCRRPGRGRRAGPMRSHRMTSNAGVRGPSPPASWSRSRPTLARRSAVSTASSSHSSARSPTARWPGAIGGTRRLGRQRGHSRPLVTMSWRGRWRAITSPRTRRGHQAPKPTPWPSRHASPCAARLSARSALGGHEQALPLPGASARRHGGCRRSESGSSTSRARSRAPTLGGGRTGGGFAGRP